MSESNRLQQRFSNYKRALASLSDAVELGNVRPYSGLEKQGVIQAFERTYQAGWGGFYQA